MAINPACRDNHALCGNNLSARANNNGNRGLNIRVARFSDSANAAVLNADIGFYNPPPINNQGIRKYSIGTVFTHSLRLTHTITDYFATAELHFLSVDCEILLYAGEEFSISESDPITDGWSKHFGIGLTRDFHESSLPITFALKP